MTSSAPAGLAGVSWEVFAARDAAPGKVLLGAGARHQLVDLVRQLTPTRIAVLTDATPILSPEGDLKADLAAALSGLGVPLDRVVLPAGTSADEAAVAAATEGCSSADVVVTVGSGTISDLGKVAAAGRRHVIVQTAASVNGYSDDESVLLRNGVKRTAHSAYADVLLADTDVIALAPADLNRAGLGDMISMFTAPADWYLANQLGMDDRWSEEAALLARRHGGEMLAAAGGIGSSQPADLDLLTSLLTLSGISMGLAGQTAPSSGMEHTVSHMLDMWAAGTGKEHHLHGAQVGVTTLWSSLLWRRMVERLDEGELPPVSLPDDAAAERLVRSVFARLDPSGRAGTECWSDYSRKLARMRGAEFTRRLDSFLSRWTSHREFLTGHCLIDPAEIARALRAAGAPVQSADLDAGDREPTIWALTHNHLMRNRFNVCDLAFATGVWGEDLAREVVAEADQLASAPPLRH